MPSAVRDTDSGWQSFLGAVKRLVRDKPRIVVGLTGTHAQAVHDKSKSGETVADIAARHEFGRGVPERSFLRSTMDENHAAYHRYLADGMKSEILNVVRSKAGAAAVDAHNLQTLKRLGLKLSADVKKKITSRIPPPNSARTIRRKGSSVPLVDSGQMLNALQFEVRKGDR